MNMDGQTVVLISTAVGGGVAGFFMLIAKIVPWRRKGNPGPNSNDRYVRKDFCELARGNMQGTLDEIKIDVRTLMRHWNVKPDGDEDE